MSDECDSPPRTYTDLHGVLELLPVTSGDRLYMRFEEDLPHFGPCGTETFPRGGVLPLAVAEGVSLEEFSEEDAVILDLAIDWDAEDLPGTVVRLERMDVGIAEKESITVE